MLERERDPKKDEPEKKPYEPGNEGEGSTSGALQYDEELDEFKKESDVEKLADEAAKEIDDDETSSGEQEAA